MFFILHLQLVTGAVHCLLLTTIGLNGKRGYPGIIEFEANRFP